MTFGDSRPGIAYRAIGHGRGVLAMGFLLVVLLSANETAVFHLLHEPHVHDTLAYAMTGLEGRPPWRAFQNRLLAPTLYALFERGVEAAFGWLGRRPGAPMETAVATFKAFAGLMIFAKNALTCALLTRLTGRPVRSLSLTALGSALFVAVSHPLFYVWDFFDLIFFTAFAYLMVRGRPVGPLSLALFLLALLNRESAMFFGLWFACVALARRFLGDPLPRREMVVGFALMLTTAIYAKATREILFVRSSSGDLDEAHAVLGNHLTLGDNLAAMLGNFSSTSVYVNGYIATMAAHGLLLARSGIRTSDAHRLALGLFVLGLLAAFMNFGLINETRVFLVYLPVLVFSAAAFAGEVRCAFLAIDDGFAFRSRR